MIVFLKKKPILYIKDGRGVDGLILFDKVSMSNFFIKLSNVKANFAYFQAKRELGP